MRVASLIFISSVALLALAELSQAKVVVCYVGTWSVYRPDKGKFDVEDIDPHLCTHLIYSFAGLDEGSSTIKSLDPWQDLTDGGGKGGYYRMTSLRQKNQNLKVTLAIGGWNEGSTKYSHMAADAGRRGTFVKSATDFLLKYKFNGLDLDWEYPTQRGGQPQDKQNFALLVKELKESFRPHGLILTAAFGASTSVIDQAYDIPTLSKYLDFMHIMTYDYGGSWDGRVTANAPLRGQGNLNIETTVDHLIKLGASPAKIVLGIPFYGRTFTTNHNGNFGDQTNGGGFSGPYTRQNGFLGYNEICTMGWEESYNTEYSQAVIKHKQGNEMRIAVFDNTRSIGEKMKYAASRNLAGAMVWSIDTDDFRGDCRQGKYPLLRAINAA